MVTNELLGFIQAQLGAGMDALELRRILIGEGGWNDGDIDEALRVLGITLRSETSKAPEAPVAPSFAKEAASPVTHAVKEAPLEVQPKPEPAPAPVTPEPLQPKVESPRLDLSAILGGQGAGAASPAGIPAPSVQKPAPSAEKSAEKVNSLFSKFSAPLSGHEQVLERASDFSVIKESRTPIPEPAKQSPSPAQNKIPVLGRRTMASDIMRAKPEPLKAAATVPPSLTHAPAAPIAPAPLPEREVKAPERLAAPDISAFSPRVAAKESPSSPLPPVGGPTAELKRPEPARAKRSILRPAIFAILAVVIFCAVAAISLILFPTGEKPEVAFSESVAKFSAAPSFSYGGSMSANLDLLVTSADGAAANGAIGFAGEYEGVLRNSSAGFGDGVHRVKFRGGMQTGDYSRSTDIEADVRRIGDSLYVRIIALPENISVDRSLFTENWIEIDLADIAAQLALEGLRGGDYGKFSGSGGGGFTSLFASQLPLSAVKDISDGSEPSGAAKLLLKTEPERLLGLWSGLYKRATNRDFLLTDDEKRRLLDALEKVKGEALVDTSTGMPLRLTLSAELDDLISGVRVKGPVLFDIGFSGYGAPVPAAEVPSPLMTLEDLKAEIDKDQKLREVRALETQKADRMKTVIAALGSYREEKGRYPAALAELFSAELIDPDTITEEQLKEFSYAAYVSESPLTGGNRCTAAKRTCDFYHIGVNFAEVSHPLLSSDTDLVSAVDGTDARGCVGGLGLACYDLTSEDATLESSLSDASTP